MDPGPKERPVDGAVCRDHRVTINICAQATESTTMVDTNNAMVTILVTIS